MPKFITGHVITHSPTIISIARTDQHCYIVEATLLSSAREVLGQFKLGQIWDGEVMTVVYSAGTASPENPCFAIEISGDISLDLEGVDNNPFGGITECLLDLRIQFAESGDELIEGRASPLSMLQAGKFFLANIQIGDREPN